MVESQRVYCMSAAQCGIMSRRILIARTSQVQVLVVTNVLGWHAVCEQDPLRLPIHRHTMESSSCSSFGKAASMRLFMLSAS